MDTEKFFKILFDNIDDDSSTCFAKNANGTKVYEIKEGMNFKWANYFSINLLHPFHNFNPCQEWHDENVPVRADHNVVCYRNILIEMDKITLEEQQKLIKEIKLPFSTAVFSGGKSIHYIVSLETPLKDRSEYDRLVNRLYKAIGENVDQANKNPSRFSRMPEVVRKETGKKQTLMWVKERVKNDELLKWIEQKIGPEVFTTPRVFKKSTDINGFTKNFLMMGAESGSRNISLFKAAADLSSFHNLEEVINIVTPICNKMGLDDLEIKNTVKSAFLRKK